MTLQQTKSSLGVSIVREWKRHKWLYGMAIPGVLIVFLFNYVPMYGILLAFKDYHIKEGILGSPWVGFKYFEMFFSNPLAVRTIKNTFLLGLYNLLWSFPAPIILALLFNELKNQRFKKIIQTISYYPNFVSTVIIIGMLSTFCASDGIFNDIRGIFGAEPVNFMGEPEYFRTLYIASGIWQGVGFGTIIYLASLSGVDPTLYDVADIDGASRFAKIWHITLPHLKPTIVILLIMAVGGTFGADSNKILLMYSPATYSTADVIGTYTYREGIQGAQFEYTTAVGLFQTVVNFIFLIVTNWIARKLSDISLF